jgi:cobalt/nickel transport system permease protein
VHIPDGLLSPAIWAGAYAVSAAAIGIAARQAQRSAQESHLPLLGVMGAFVFAAQMVNFPLGFGTSGHLVGSVLLAVTLGPPAAMVVMTAVLLVQALVFQDGGLLALGANVFNMAVAGLLAGYLPWALWGRSRLRWIALAAGGFLSVAVSGALAMAELALSGVRIAPVLAWTAAGLFAINGAIEGLLTVAIVRALAVLQTRTAEASATARRVTAALGIAALSLATGAVAMASQSPDALDSLVERTGIAGRVRAWVATPLAEYRLAWAPDSWWGQVLAGLAGLALIYPLAVALARAFRKRRSA